MGNWKKGILVAFLILFLFLNNASLSCGQYFHSENEILEILTVNGQYAIIPLNNTWVYRNICVNAFSWLNTSFLYISIDYENSSLNDTVVNVTFERKIFYSVILQGNVKTMIVSTKEIRVAYINLRIETKTPQEYKEELEKLKQELGIVKMQYEEFLGSLYSVGLYAGIGSIIGVFVAYLRTRLIHAEPILLAGGRRVKIEETEVEEEEEVKEE